jgi:hypothetical protein
LSGGLAPYASKDRPKHAAKHAIVLSVEKLFGLSSVKPHAGALRATIDLEAVILFRFEIEAAFRALHVMSLALRLSPFSLGLRAAGL